MSGRDFRNRVVRRARRMREARSRSERFWSGLALVGALGWMLVLPMVGGVLLGHYLDQRFGTGVSFSLALLLLGLGAGAYGVWRFFLRELT